MKYLVATFLALCCLATVHGQDGASISGKVQSAGEPVPFAGVGIPKLQLGTAADADGAFEMRNIPAGEHEVLVSAVGFRPLKVKVVVTDGEEVSVSWNMAAASTELGEVVVTGTMKEMYVDESPVKVEVLTPKFLQTQPTSSVIEALQNVNGVQEQINCGVCGTNDIHINGMEGPYTLVLIDGMPIMSALASVYGFNGIPTALIERVEIVKGPSSTLYGTEAVGGVINIITKKAAAMPLLSLNSFVTTHGESNLDLAISPKIGKRLSSTLSANVFRNQYRMDFNNDGFTDIPLNSRISLFNKWSLQRKDGGKADLAARYYSEDRFGGTMDWQKRDRGSNTVYGESIQTQRLELIGSYDLPIKGLPLRLDYSFNSHDQDSYYGSTSYIANQKILFANLLWNSSFSRHEVTTGLTTRYETYEDNSLAESDQEDYIPGLFVQDLWTLAEKTVVLAGIRADYHDAHGLIFSPRLSVKQDLGDYTTARINAGTGFRRVHLFTEDHAALTGARTVVIQNDLRPEESQNINLNLRRTYVMGEGVGNMDVDVFYTRFSNKIIPNYDIDPNLIVYDNIAGHGVARGVSAHVEHQIPVGLTVNAGGTFLDVYQVVQDENGDFQKEFQEFAPRFSGTFSIGYEIKKLGINLNYTGRVMGPQWLPTYPDPFSREEVSPWYSIQNFQLTKSFENLEFYIGLKNLLNYTQPTPLIDPANPFGDSFDTAYAYGPLQVRRAFFGLRWSLARNQP